MTRQLIMAWTRDGSKATNCAPGIFQVGEGVAVAIEVADNNMNFSEMAKEHELKFFEVEQQNFRALVRHAKSLGVQILTIGFHEPFNEVDAVYKMSIERRIHEAIALQDGFAMDDEVYLYSLRGIDVESVTFQIGGTSVRYSRLGDISISGGTETDDEIKETVNATSVRLLTGLVRRDQL